MDVRQARKVQMLANEYRRLKEIQSKLTISDNWVIEHAKIVQALSVNVAVQSAADAWITGRLSAIENALIALDVDISSIGEL